MPGENIYDWSKTAASNGSADSLINWLEGQARASVNDSARSMMAAHAKVRDLTNGSITTGGTANAQTVNSGMGFTAVPTGMRIMVKNGFSNDAAMTLELDGIGAVAVKTMTGADLKGSEVIADSYSQYLYDGTNWILLQFSTTIINTVILNTTVIDTTTSGGAGSASVDFVNSTEIDFTAFDEYVLSAVGLVPKVDTVNFYMRVSEDAGVTWKSSVNDYRWCVLSVAETVSGPGMGVAFSTPQISIFTLQDFGPQFAASFNLHLFAPNNNTSWKTVTFQGVSGSSAYGLAGWYGAGCYWGTNNPINGLRFFFSSGNIAAGTFTLYGVKK